MLSSLQEGELASWDDWSKNDSGLVSIKVESPNEQSEQQQEEIDLFGDMQPVFQKPKKVWTHCRSAMLYCLFFTTIIITLFF